MKEKDWDLLFEKLDNMTDEEFSRLADELDAMGEVPFAIAEIEDETITLPLLPEELGEYYSYSAYNVESQYVISVLCDREMAA
jgi:hypothetical protein